MLALPRQYASYVKLSFDGQTAHSLSKYLIDEVMFFEALPEPSALVLAALGLAALGLVRRRRTA